MEKSFTTSYLKTVCAAALLALAALFAPVIRAQPVSHTSGFYSQDSVFFTVNLTPQANSDIQVAVNCFTDSCFSIYAAGFWLYNRNLLPNTWEDQKLSKGGNNFNIDTLAPRGHLQKVNVIRVREITDSGHIRWQQAYFVGLTGANSALLHRLPVVHLLADSLDTFGPQGFYGPGEGLATPFGHVWNYDIDRSPLYGNAVPVERIEKKAIVEILDTANNSLLYHTCGIRLSGNSSRSLPNKGMAIVAREPAHYGVKRFHVDFGKGQKDYKWLRFRAGASAQWGGFGTHEIFERIIDGLKIGEVEVFPVVTYLNGSYWSLAFAQDKVQEYTVERLFGVDHDDVDLVRPIDVLSYNDLLPLIQANQMDTSQFIWTVPPGNSALKTIGMVDEGSKAAMEHSAITLFEAALNPSVQLSYNQIDSLIDVLSWLTYLSVAEYSQFGLGYQVVMGTAPGKKVFLLRNEGDHFGMHDVATDYWQDHFLNPQEVDTTLTSLVFRNVIMKNNECVELYCLRAQDLLNTTFDSARTKAIVPDIANAVMSEYDRHWLSWAPNSGLAPNDANTVFQEVEDYCRNRPAFSWQHLATQWLPSHNFTLTNRKQVRLVFDSIPGVYARVKLNTLYIDSNWKGLYYPNPALRVGVDSTNLPLNTELKWKEYPDSALSFSLHADSAITLTLVLKDNSVSVSSMEDDMQVYLMPNPTSENVQIVTAVEVLTVKVLSLEGREMLTSTSSRFSVSELPAGCYVCVINTAQGTATRRLVIAR